MKGEHIMLDSRPMGRRMHLWKYGHFGAPLLAFPSAAGMAHEWDSHGMVEALSDLIQSGRIKLYTTESNVAEAWTRREEDPKWRIHRHDLYEQYITSELVPWIREDCRTPDIRIACAGTSLGAFYSANFTLKNPGIFNYALCMSGRYEMSSLNEGYDGPGAFENNPIAYVPHMHGNLLETARREAHITLVVGQGKWEDGNIEETQHLAHLLNEKGISVTCDVWGHDVSHDWAWWQRQTVMHVGNRFGG